jgi:hypothetical protein
LEGEKVDQMVTLSVLSVESSLGALQGSGRARVSDLFELRSLEGEAKLRLTEEGVRTLGPYLALAAGVKNDGKEWSFKVTKHRTGAFNYQLTPAS